MGIQLMYKKFPVRKPYVDVERVFRALANKRRINIVCLLKDKRVMSVGEISVEMKLSLTATSRHLTILYGAKLVEKEQKGLEVYYRINASLSSEVRNVIAFATTC